MRRRRRNEPTVWEATTGARVLTVASVVVCAVPALALSYFATVDGELLEAVVSVAVFLVGGAVALGWVFRSKVVCEPNELVVVNFLCERRINWGAIAGARPGYYGVVIELKDGRRVTATAVQKANASTWLGRRTRSDDLVDVITGRVHRRRF